MKLINLPADYNYIGAFLTLRCNMNCDYCLNRQGDFKMSFEMSGDNWIEGLKRLPGNRQDLPITFQGGEPTIHPDFFYIVCFMATNERPLDLLTNGLFNPRDFSWAKLNEYEKISEYTFSRNAPYANIRISFHKGVEMLPLVLRARVLKRNSHKVGIWGLDNNEIENREMKKLCDRFGIDFRIKEYLDKTHGTYKYPDAISGTTKFIASSTGISNTTGLIKSTKKVLCRTTELLIGPSGHIFRCHADLYANRGPIAHILDEDIKLGEFLPCENYGLCNPCDVKQKFDRFQIPGYCSVEIKEI